MAFVLLIKRIKFISNALAQVYLNTVRPLKWFLNPSGFYFRHNFIL